MSISMQPFQLGLEDVMQRGFEEMSSSFGEVIGFSPNQLDQKGWNKSH